MKLFKYEDYQVVISEEALLLKPFKKIWDRDKTRGKTKALNELSYIYFMFDPRSEYMFIIDELERFKQIKEGLGISPTWSADKVVEEAITLYKQLTTTSASILLDTVRESVDKLAKELRSIDYTERTNGGSLVYSPNMVVATIEKALSLTKKIVDAEKLLNEQIKETSKMRGAGTKKILEDGFLG